MSTREKLIKRFKRLPKDFTWDELVRLFGFFGFLLDSKGKTSGSGVQFVKDGEVHALHKPHPTNVIKAYALKRVYNFLNEKGFLKESNEDNENEDNSIKKEDNEKFGV